MTLLSRYGWRWTLVAMSALCVLCLLAGCVMSPPAPATAGGPAVPRRRKSTVVSTHGTIVEDLSRATEQTEAAARGRGWARRLLEALLSPELAASPALPTYLLVAAADGVATLALFIPFTYLPDLAVSRGIAPDNAAFLISAAGQQQLGQDIVVTSPTSQPCSLFTFHIHINSTCLWDHESKPTKLSHFTMQLIEHEQ